MLTAHICLCHNVTACPGVAYANDPDNKARAALEVKDASGQAVDKAHEGIDAGQGKTHSAIDSTAPKVRM